MVGKPAPFNRNGIVDKIYKAPTNPVIISDFFVLIIAACNVLDLLFHVPSLVITDNNIGLVEIAFNNNDEVSYISHQLLVHKGKNLKVHATKVIAS